jgi:hypothetical protein
LFPAPKRGCSMVLAGLELGSRVGAILFQFDTTESPWNGASMDVPEGVG